MVDKVIAVVSQTKESAKRLAEDLGHDTKYIFGARMGIYFEGLRADLVLIDTGANIPRDFLRTIKYNALKLQGARVRYVSAGPVWEGL